jgi:hypothetical protein
MRAGLAAAVVAALVGCGGGHPLQQGGAGHGVDAAAAAGGEAGAGGGAAGAAGDTDAGPGGSSGGGGAGGASGAGGAGGASGAGGATSGVGGAGGAACTLEDATKIITTTSKNPLTGCTVIGACHDSEGSAAGLDLATMGWQTRLVGKGPVSMKGSAQSNYSKCAGMGLVYLQPGSKPATGLIVDKLDPAGTAPCGSHMPDLTVNLSARDFACLRSYLTTLTSP